jgi:uncharacterized phage protein gp47/JayE
MASTLSVQNFSTLVSNMAAAVQNSAAGLLDLTVGSVLRAILEGSAASGLWIQSLILTVLQQTRLATSVGTQCDTFGADFGFYRLAAVYATGFVQFTRYTATLSAFIPNGSQVRSADGTQTFTVIADTTNTLYNGSTGFTIPAGTSSGSLQVIASNAGTQGNVLAGTIQTIVGAIPGIDYCSNSVGFTNGVNAETDAAFKARFANFVATRAAGTLAALQLAIASIAPNITATLVVASGSVTAYVDDGTGSPSSATLSLVASAMTTVRAAGIATYALAATLVTATVTATITVNSTTVKASILPAVAQAVTAYINALPEGAVLPYSRLAQVIYDANPGITNVTNLLVNGATADLGGAGTQVIRSGVITLS